MPTVTYLTKATKSREEEEEGPAIDAEFGGEDEGGGEARAAAGAAGALEGVDVEGLGAPPAALGARRVDWDSYPDDPDFVVLADPDGNRFCIVDVAHTYG